MKIKTAERKYEEVLTLPREERKRPKRIHRLFRILIRVLSEGELRRVNFRSRSFGMEKLGAGEPCLILMNHSSFIDLKIASALLYPRPFHIVCTSDGFVGKEWLMRNAGCIPTRKFMTDPHLVKDMLYALRELKSSVLMYPEASYSFDGTATPLPEGLGKCLKILQVPVVLIRTYGAFTYDPLYNNLRKRKVNVSADISYLLSPEEIGRKTPEELNATLREAFSFDHFRWQQENRVRVSEPFRAEDLNRVLYKCPHCQTEGQMKGSGARLVCRSCGKEYELTEYGYMKALDGETEFPHIPDWYRWQRECVRRELVENRYALHVPVDIYMMVNTKCVYRVGEGELNHSAEGFHLTGCDGRLDYRQGPRRSYSLYSDYYWYEIGDMICLGDRKALYYCFPHVKDVAAKARLAVEELYKMKRRALHTDVGLTE